METTATIDALPDLALSRVLGVLPADDLARTAAVCRRFAALIAADDALLWRPHVLPQRAGAVRPERPASSWRAEFATSAVHAAARSHRWWRTAEARARRARLFAAVADLEAEHARLVSALSEAEKDVDMARSGARPPSGARVAWADGDVVLTHEGGGGGGGGATAAAPPPEAARRIFVGLSRRLEDVRHQLARARVAARAEVRRSGLAERVVWRDQVQCWNRRFRSIPGMPDLPASSPVWRPVAAGEGLPPSHVGTE